MGLEGKRVVITGGAGNLGGVMCRRLRAAGVKIALVYRSSGGAAADAVIFLGADPAGSITG